MSGFNAWSCFSCGATGTGEFPEEHLGVCPKTVVVPVDDVRLQLLQAQRQIAAQEQHISELEKSLENVRKERDEVLRIGKQFEAESRKHFEQSCTNLQRAEKAERECDNHRQSAETWRKRVEVAADALADVLPGEVGRLDLLARIAELRRQRDEALARVDRLGVAQQLGAQREEAWRDATGCMDPEAARLTISRLKPSGQVAEDVEQIRFVLATHLLQIGSATTDALSRLAAQAQGYEAAMTDFTRLANEAASGSLAPDLYQTNGGRGAAEAVAKTIAARTSEMMTAVADNAALVKELRVLVDMPQEQWDALRTACLEFHMSRTTGVGGSAICACGASNGGSAACRPLRALAQVRDLSVLHDAQPHPGAALLERMTRLEEALAAGVQACRDRESAGAKAAHEYEWGLNGKAKDERAAYANRLSGMEAGFCATAVKSAQQKALDH